MKSIMKILIITLLLLTALDAQNLRQIKHETFDVSEGGLIEVDASVGDVTIAAWDKNEVDVKILGNRRAADKLDFYIDEKSNGVEVRIKREGLSLFNWFSNINVRVEIKVPVKYDADIETSGGDLEIYDLDGFIELSTSGGDILTEKCLGELKTSTSGGDINIEEHKGSGYFSTSGGDIKLLDFEGDVKASTSGGDIELRVENGEVDAETTGGDVKLDYMGLNKGIYLSTTGGSVKIKVPTDIEANVNLSTFGGDADLDHSKSRIIKMKSSEIRAKLNGGGEQIKCKTFGGDVILTER